MAHLYRRVRFAFERLAAAWLRRCGWTIDCEPLVMGWGTASAPIADMAKQMQRAHVRTTQRVAPFETCSPPEQTGVVGPAMFVPHDAPSVIIGRVDLPQDAGR